MSVLKEIVDGRIWVAEDDLFMPGGVHFPVRMTIIKLKSGGLWLHSPITITDAMADEINALGNVEHIVAPNCFHHLYAGPAKERYKDATLHAPRGLTKKRKDLSFDNVLTNEECPWPEDFEQHKMGGTPALQEVVFFHRETKTLIVTDLVFNIHETKNFLSKMVFRFVANAWQRVAQSNLVRFATKDKVAAGTSAQRLFEWDFSRLMMAHGLIVEENAQEELRSGLRWMLSHAPKSLPSGAQAVGA